MREREGRKDIITAHHAIREPRFENQQTVQRNVNNRTADRNHSHNIPRIWV